MFQLSLGRGSARLGYDLVSWGTISTSEIYTPAPLLHMQRISYLNIDIERVYIEKIFYDKKARREKNRALKLYIVRIYISRIRGRKENYHVNIYSICYVLNKER